MTARARDNWQWAITLVIWLVGAAAIWRLWDYHLPIRALDEVYGFALYLIAFFYFLALGPVHALVQWYWPGARQEREEYHRRLFTE